MVGVNPENLRVINNPTKILGENHQEIAEIKVKTEDERLFRQFSKQNLNLSTVSRNLQSNS